MFRFARIGLLAVSLLPAAGNVARDWRRHPAVVTIDGAPQIWAIGDIHGDYERLVRLLRTAGLIAAKPATAAAWSGGNAVLVITGDMIDKGPRSVEVLRMVRALGRGAAAAGGRVVALMGNHEAEFLAQPDAGKSAGFASELRAEGLDPADTAACRGDIGRFLCDLPMAARVGEWFFCHAGNTAGRTVPQLSSDIVSGVGRDGFASSQLIGADSLLEARLTLKGAATRPWVDADVPRRSASELLATNLDALGARHLVEGHQPSDIALSGGTERKAGEMFQLYGRLFLIDVGMSRGVGDSQGAALHIVSGDSQVSASAVCSNGKVTPLWDSASRPAIGRAAPCGE
ncbi:MAG: metallophosphoesterase [Bryobacteraceae bacterium]|jgi:hypothetical protein